MGHQAKKALGAILTKDGAEFRVWAPFAKTVKVLVGEASSYTETIMANEGDGYWSASVKDVKAGEAYRFNVTSQQDWNLEKNDPYARQLTVSDNGRSVIVDDSFDWEDVTFSPVPKEKQIIYELHIGTFNRPDAATSGTFESAIQKLDYLQSLGINMIELMPVTAMAQSNGWGYAPNHLFAVENAYGGRHGLLEFIKQCHKRNIGVILDVVYNHFSAQTDLWQYDGWSENNRGGIYFYNDERGDTPWGGRPDYGREEVRQLILDNVTMWLTEYRIDGLRVDSTTYMRNTKGPEGNQSTEIADAWKLLQDMTTLAHKINPAAVMIAEDSSSNDAITKPVSEGGAGFDAQWAIPFPYALRKALGINNTPSIDDLWNETIRAYNGQVFQKVIFSDSHDTAANGSTRLNQAASPLNPESVEARKRQLVANAVTLTAPGIPMLLQGEEFMQQGSFNAWQMLEWGKTVQFAGIVMAHQHINALRVNTYGNTGGLSGYSSNLFHRDDANAVIGYHRWTNGGLGDDVIVIVNLGPVHFKDYKINVPIPGLWHVRFNSSWKGYSPDFVESKTANAMTDGDSNITIELSDYNVLILSQ